MMVSLSGSVWGCARLYPEPHVPGVHRQDNSGGDRKRDLPLPPPPRTPSLSDHGNSLYFTPVAVTHAAEERLIVMLYLRGSGWRVRRWDQEALHYNMHCLTYAYQVIYTTMRLLLIIGVIWCASLYTTAVWCWLPSERSLTGIYRLLVSICPLGKHYVLLVFSSAVLTPVGGDGACRKGVTKGRLCYWC